MKTLTWQKPGQQNVAQELIKIIINYVAELRYKNIGKAADKSIKDTSYASDMKGKNFFFVINMDAILELPIVKMMTGFGGEEYQTYYNLASQVSYLEVSNVSDGVSEVDLILKNKDTNSLKQIVDFVKKFTGM